jgi:hypothetical protein
LKPGGQVGDDSASASSSDCPTGSAAADVEQLKCAIATRVRCGVLSADIGVARAAVGAEESAKERDPGCDMCDKTEPFAQPGRLQALRQRLSHFG